MEQREADRVAQEHQQERFAELLGLGRVVLMLGVAAWMYGGYAWLTNAVAPTSRFRRTLMSSTPLSRFGGGNQGSYA